MSRVLIIGAGVIGLSSAYYAARRGWKVTVIDCRPEDYPGCSYGNAGMIVPSHFVPLAAPGAVSLALRWMGNPESPFWIKPRLDPQLVSWGIKFWRAANRQHVERAAPVLRDLHLASRNAFEELALEGGNEFGLVTRGLLMLCKTNHALEEEGGAAEQARALGVPAEVLSGEETAKLDPAVRMDVAGSVFFPKDCHLVPQKFMEFLKRRCLELGVEFSYSTEAEGIRAERGQIRALRTDAGEITAEQYVLAAGSWSSTFGQQIKLKLPMQAGKGYSLTLQNPPQLPNLCAILTEARVAVTPMDGALRVGGTMEMAGLSEAINPVRVRGIIKAVPQYYPDFRPDHFAEVKPWSGLRPCSPDGLPYLGRTSSYSNLVVATGHAMMGLSLGPISGKAVAEILSDEVPSVNLQMLNPDRYA